MCFVLREHAKDFLLPFPILKVKEKILNRQTHANLFSRERKKKSKSIQSIQIFIDFHRINSRFYCIFSSIFFPACAFTFIIAFRIFFFNFSITFNYILKYLFNIHANIDLNTLHSTQSKRLNTKNQLFSLYLLYFLRSSCFNKKNFSNKGFA